MARIKEIEVSIGMTIEVKGVWIKPVVGIKLDLNEDDSKPGNRADIFERAFEIAESELDKEIDRLDLGEHRDKIKENRAENKE